MPDDRRRTLTHDKSSHGLWPGELKTSHQKQESPVVAIFVYGSGRYEHSLQRTADRCFLPSFGSFGQAVSEEKIFRNRPIRNKNYLWWPCLLMDQDEMSTLYRGPPIDASYQVSVHLAKRFQRRRIFKSVNQKQESTVADMFVNGSGRNEQPLQRTFHRCFLPSFSSFGQAVSEEKIFNQRLSGLSLCHSHFILL